MNLVIVESPAKSKTIAKYLGKDYKVLASKGHIIDLPKSELGIDVDNKFKPKYIVTKEQSLKQLKDAFKQADSLILAVDRDREGEAIGWHIAQKLGAIDSKGKTKPGKKVSRIVFTEITESAIKKALTDAQEINMNLVDAQQARRVLDRLVGYKLSPLLWKKIRFGLSAGRVQSVALKLIVEREEERDKFNPEEYWTLNAYTNTTKTADPKHKVILSGSEKIEFSDKLLKFELKKVADKKAEIKEQEKAEKVIEDVIHEKWVIDNIESKEIFRSPKAPLITSTLQRSAANLFGYSAKQTMSIAQKLYENGMITYMRTDSVNIAQEAVTKMQAYIKNNYGENYLASKSRNYKNTSKNSQEAHEAIRPTDITKQASDLKLDEKSKKIYQLIWQVALGSLMNDAKLESKNVSVVVKNYTFSLTGQRILFPGFLIVTKEKLQEQNLPQLKIGQEIFLEELVAEQNFTRPPARYTEATLIKALEAYGIGRPSTYAPTISTIMARKYVEKENRYLIPTDTGIVVTKLLRKHFPDVVDVNFTADVENKLDDISRGGLKWVEMIGDFYKPFITNLEKKEKELKREEFNILGKSDEKCPECGKSMDIKLGRYGRFLSCSNFPNCKGMRSMDGKTEEELEKEAYTEDFQSKYEAPPKTEDGRDYLLKNGRYGKFFAHPDYPKVKDAKPLVLRKDVFRKIYGNPPKASDGKVMVLLRGKFGEFFAHPDYPEKKEVVRVNKKEVAEKKQELGIE